MEYNIIATLGPQSQTESVWESFLSAGVDSFRLNTSHLSLEQLKTWLLKISSFYSELNIRYPVVLDLQGSKWRLGDFPESELVNGQMIKLIYSLESNDAKILPVPHRDFFEAALTSGKEIILNDAKVVLSLQSADNNSLTARVEKGGVISSKKGVTFLSTAFRRESLSEKDKEILEYSRQFDFIRYAVSYIKDSSEMAFYRKNIGSSAYLIAKLERADAINEALEIAEYADELWICRGDLGAELGMRLMALAVESISDIIGKIKVPVIMAGQVLEHMTRHSSPTRSEVCYIYDSLLKGYSGFVLSDECAIGKYPLESCRTAAMFR